ncbi:MAG: AMP-binding protein [Acidimicrobiales bacterium]
MLDALRGRLEADPDGPFLDFEGCQLSAAELDSLANRAASGLASLGVGIGDRVANLLENGPAAAVAWLAAVKLGAVAAPVNTAFKGEFLRHQLADSGARAIVVQADLAPRLAVVIAQLPELEVAVVAGEPGAGAGPDPGSPEVAGELGIPVVGWSDLLSSATAAAPESNVAPEQLATLIYTAGTTGPSKGCMLSHAYLVTLARQIATTWGRASSDAVWTPLPLFHANAVTVAVIGTMLTGGRASIARRFSVSGFWPEIVRTRATIACMLGSLAILLASAPDHPDQEEGGRTLRLTAAAPMPPAIDEMWRDRFGVKTFSAGYGITEASLLSSLPPGESNRPGAAGRRNDVEFDVRIFDDHDQELEPDGVGEIVARPRRPQVMFDGYWGRPEATLAITGNLWLHTGDLGRIDEDGFLYFVDRKKDYLRRRGENISSFELEKTFFGHEAIADVAVHAVPSEVGEDEVKVTAILDEGADLTEEDLCRWAIDRLPFFAVPRYIEFRADMPRNAVGRVLKYRLREDGVTPQTWDREAAGLRFERR